MKPGQRVFLGVAGVLGVVMVVVAILRWGSGGHTRAVTAPEEASALSQEIAVALRWSYSDEPSVRASALVLLRRLCAAPLSGSDQRRVLRRMEEIVNRDPDPQVIGSALSTVSALDHEQFADLVFKSLAAGSSPAKRAAANLVAQAMTPARGPRLLELLRGTFEDPILAEQRMSLVQGLERAPTSGAAEILHRMLSSGSDPNERDRLAHLLALQPGPIDVFVDALTQLGRNDGQYYGRQALVTALGRRGDRRASEAIVAQLASQHESLRVEAMRALARLQDPIAAPALIERFRRAAAGSYEERVINEILQAGYAGLTLPRQIEADPTGARPEPKLSDDYQQLLAQRAASVEPPARGRGTR